MVIKYFVGFIFTVFGKVLLLIVSVW